MPIGHEEDEIQSVVEWAIGWGWRRGQKDRARSWKVLYWEEVWVLFEGFSEVTEWFWKDE